MLMWKLVCTLNLLWSRSKLIPQNKGIRFFELRFKHCRILSSGLGQVSVSSVQIVFSLASVKRELCARCSTWERPRPICFKKAARKQETLRFQLWFFRGKRYKYLSLSLWSCCVIKIALLVHRRKMTWASRIMDTKPEQARASHSGIILNFGLAMVWLGSNSSLATNGLKGLKKSNECVASVPLN